MSDPHLINVENLTIEYPMSDGGVFRAIDNFSMRVQRGQIVGVVGESGAGKSTIGKAALGLLDENAVIDTGSVLLEDMMVSHLDEHMFANVRGNRVGYIYQNPMTALNPVLTIGEQIIEAIEANTDKRGKAARDYAINLLKQAEVPLPEARLDKYPHQLSGGMCQRVVFAIAICAKPELIIADEPTTALDVTVQKAVLDTLVKLTRQENIAHHPDHSRYGRGRRDVRPCLCIAPRQAGGIGTDRTGTATSDTGLQPRIDGSDPPD